MALANTTLAAAVTLLDNQITVASGTSIAAGQYVSFGPGLEIMRVASNYVTASVTVPVLRAQEGTIRVTHVSGAQISFYVLSTDLPLVGPQLSVSSPYAGRGRYLSTITTSGAFTPRQDNQDELVEINGTSVVAITLTSPLRSMTGKVVTFIGNGIAAHTITYTTTGFGNVGATADLVTFGTTQMNSFQMIACGGFWLILGGFGTATINVTGPTVA